MDFEPTEQQIEAALAHAEQVQPFESCGVISEGSYVPLKNLATVPNTFALDMREYCQRASSRGVEAVVHSHVYLPPIASDADLTMCENTGLPWLIVSWPLRTHSIIRPSGYRAPLVGRQWAWGSLDCYGLIRDAFEAYTGIRIPDFDRDWLFWEKKQDLILEHYEAAGFVKQSQGTQPQHCDVMGMRIRAPVVNHLGIFLEEPQGGVLLHQLQGRLSVREIYGGTYLNATELHLRHRKFIE
jgi:proteasome lid subunit RPN8/RPN11